MIGLSSEARRDDSASLGVYWWLFNSTIANKFVFALDLFVSLTPS